MSIPSSYNTTEFVPESYSHQSTFLSEEAITALKGKMRFTDYLQRNIWPLCRQGFNDVMQPNSLQASQDLLSKVDERIIAGHRVLELTPKTFNAEHKLILYFHGGLLLWDRLM